MPSVIKGLSRQLWIYNRARDFSLSLSTINIGVSTWTWFFFFFFPRPFILTRIDTFFFPPLSLLCCRGAVPKRRFARSGRLPVRPPSQSDEMLGISQVSRRAEKTRQRESIDLHARHTVTLSSLELGSRGFPVRWVASGKSLLSLTEWIFFDFFQFFFLSFKSVRDYVILSFVDADLVPSIFRR